MRLIISVFGILILFSCSEDKRFTGLERSYFEYDKNKVEFYFDILDNLNQKGYVTDYRMLKKYEIINPQERHNGSVPQWAVEDDSVFLADSVSYWENRKLLFAQDRDFINWLLSFKNETSDKSLQSKHTTLWTPFVNPLRSTILGMSQGRSEQALHLICYFLDEENVGSSSWTGNGSDCPVSDYQLIEAFLIKNSHVSMKRLRELWAMEVEFARYQKERNK